MGRVGFDKAKTKGRENAPFEIRYQNGKGPEVLLASGQALEAMARARKKMRRQAASFPQAARKEAGKSLDDPFVALDPTLVGRPIYEPPA